MKANSWSGECSRLGQASSSANTAQLSWSFALPANGNSDYGAALTRRAGFTLIEVVAGLMLLATLLVTMLLAIARGQRLNELSENRQTGASIADRLLAGWVDSDRGIPLGMPISPLFCNVYLHRLDWSLVRRRWSPVRYADDFVVCCLSRSQAERAREVVANILDGLRLSLEPNKTRVTSFDEGFEYLGVRFQGDSYSFAWEGKRFEVEGPTPRWIWGYMPTGYE